MEPGIHTTTTNVVHETALSESYEILKCAEDDCARSGGMICRRRPGPPTCRMGIPQPAYKTRPTTIFRNVCRTRASKQPSVRQRRNDRACMFGIYLFVSRVSRTRDSQTPLKNPCRQQVNLPCMCLFPAFGYNVDTNCPHRKETSIVTGTGSAAANYY